MRPVSGDHMKKTRAKQYQSKRAANRAANRQGGFQEAKSLGNGKWVLKKAKAPAYKSKRLGKGLYSTKQAATIASNMRAGSEGVKKVGPGKYRVVTPKSVANRRKAARAKRKATRGIW